MKLDKVANSGNDEFYTPEYAITPLLKYIPSGSKIWCPFDTSDSLFVKLLTLHGCDVLSTHISRGEDFFQLSNSEIADWCDYIISNPPYSIKTEILDELFSIGKPFAMLLGCAGIFESQKRFEMFRDNEFEVMMFNRRISYFKDYEEQKPSKNPPFSSWYICSNVLDKHIVFEEIIK